MPVPLRNLLRSVAARALVLAAVAALLATASAVPGCLLTGSRKALVNAATCNATNPDQVYLDLNGAPECSGLKNVYWPAVSSIEPFALDGCVADRLQINNYAGSYDTIDLVAHALSGLHVLTDLSFATTGVVISSIESHAFDNTTVDGNLDLGHGSALLVTGALTGLHVSGKLVANNLVSEIEPRAFVGAFIGGDLDIDYPTTATSYPSELLSGLQLGGAVDLTTSSALPVDEFAFRDARIGGRLSIRASSVAPNAFAGAVLGEIGLSGTVPTLVAHSFGGVQVSGSVNLQGVGISSLQSHAFSASTFGSLILSGNSIGSLVAGTFSNATVQSIALRDSGISSIEQGAFAGCACGALALSGSTVGVLGPGMLPSGLLSGNLDLSDAGIDSIDVAAFRDVFATASLILRSNPLSTLDAAVFSGVRIDGDLDLRGCGITSLDARAFDQVGDIAGDVLLGLNNLGVVQSNTFANMRIGGSLQLGFSGITSLEPRAFTGTIVAQDLLFDTEVMICTESFDDGELLRTNNLGVVPSYAFADLRIGGSLRLGVSGITGFQAETFAATTIAGDFLGGVLVPAGKSVASELCKDIEVDEFLPSVQPPPAPTTLGAVLDRTFASLTVTGDVDLRGCHVSSVEDEGFEQLQVGGRVLLVDNPGLEFMSASVLHSLRLLKVETAETASFNCTAAGQGVVLVGASGAQACSDCTAGSYCPSGFATPVPCPLGTYNAVIKATTSASCTPCPAGTYGDREGSARGSDCQFCPVGTSSAELGAKSVADCEECEAGSYSAAPGRATCELCPAGTFLSSRGAATALLCTPCPADTWSSETGATSSSSCVPCTAQRPFSAAGSTSPADCTVAAIDRGCPPGFYEDASSGDCEACPAGTHNPLSLQQSPDACVPCPPGSVSYDSGASACELCGIGTLAGEDSLHCQSPADGGCTRDVETANGLVGAVQTPQALVCPPGVLAPISASALQLIDDFASPDAGATLFQDGLGIEARGNVSRLLAAGDAASPGSDLKGVNSEGDDGVAMAAVGSVLTVLAAAFFAVRNKLPEPLKLIHQVDALGLAHHVPNGEAVRKRMTPHGTAATLLFAVVGLLVAWSLATAPSEAVLVSYGSRDTTPVVVDIAVTLKFLWNGGEQSASDSLGLCAASSEAFRLLSQVGMTSQLSFDVSGTDSECSVTLSCTQCAPPRVGEAVAVVSIPWQYQQIVVSVETSSSLLRSVSSTAILPVVRPPSAGDAGGGVFAFLGVASVHFQLEQMVLRDATGAVEAAGFEPRATGVEVARRAAALPKAEETASNPAAEVVLGERNELHVNLGLGFSGSTFQVTVVQTAMQRVTAILAALSSGFGLWMTLFATAERIAHAAARRKESSRKDSRSKGRDAGAKAPSAGVQLTVNPIRGADKA